MNSLSEPGRDGSPTRDASTAPTRYTLHLDFLAADDKGSIYQAEAYAEALNYLRMEIDSYSAQVSPAGNWTTTVAVFCNAPGPDPADVCTKITGHSGGHHGPGPTPEWRDADIPTAPDTIEGIT